jgi:hypothetical protein
LELVPAASSQCAQYVEANRRESSNHWMFEKPGGKVHLTSRPSNLDLREVNHVAWLERLRSRVRKDRRACADCASQHLHRIRSTTRRPSHSGSV